MILKNILIIKSLSECAGPGEQVFFPCEHTENGTIGTNQLDFWIPSDIINHVETRKEPPLGSGFCGRMILVRLLLLAVLLYVGWRLFRNYAARKQADAQRQGDDPGLQGILVEDPVCHVLVPKHQALRLRRDGITYYFCSERCCDQFTGEPEKGEK